MVRWEPRLVRGGDGLGAPTGVVVCKGAGSAQLHREGQDGCGWEEARGELQPPYVLLLS